MAERGRGVWALLFFFYSVGCICSVSCLPYMQMLSSVSAKACCLMHTVAADCSLWSTDVNGVNGGISAFLSNFKVDGIQSFRNEPL